MDPETRPAPYRVAERKEWIVCDELDLEGFAILVRTSITNAEQASLRARNDEIEGAISEAYWTLPPEGRDLDQSPWAMQKRLMAPYILDWNAEGQDMASGEWRPLPAPAEAGAEIFEAVTFREALWCFEVCIGGYYLTGKAGPWRSRSSDAGSTPANDSPAADPPLAPKKRRRGQPS